MFLRGSLVDLGLSLVEADKKLMDEWFRGPDWFQDQTEWPKDIQTKANNYAESDTKVIKSMLKVKMW